MPDVLRLRGGGDVIEQEAPVHPMDVAVAVSAGALGVAAGVARRASAALHPVTGMLLRPRMLPPRLHPARWMEARSQEGAERRAALRAGVSQRLDQLVPVVLAEVLGRARLTELILQFVDLDRVVAAVDLDAAAAQLDVSAVVERVDVEPIVDRVDLDAAARRLDVDAVLDRLDLTSVVLERVDLGALVHAVLAQVDLVALAAEVIEGVDLPEIIRESTGSLASDTVRGVRMQGIFADEAVGRAVDRLLLRRGHTSTHPPTPAHESSSSPTTVLAPGRPDSQSEP